MTRLKRDASPALGAMQSKVITTLDVLAMVRTAKARGAPDVSRRLKQHVSRVGPAIMAMSSRTSA